MQNFQDLFETRKRSFIRAFSICMTAPLNIMKMRVKMKNRSHRSDINRTRPRHGYKYAKYEMCLSMMMVMCKVTSEAGLIKKLSNIFVKTVNTNSGKSCILDV